MRFNRVKAIFKEDFQKIKKANVLIIGVGGVGGVCLDVLYKSGVSNITIIDFDRFDETNQNRQIGSENIGEKKTLVLSRIYPNIKYIDTKITPKWVEMFNFDEFDIVVDAIDDIEVKVAIAHKTYKKLISSCGAAKRIDPTKIKVDSIWKTTNDPFAKKFRYELKKSNFKYNFEAVYSTETPIDTKELGSFVGVTGAMGLTLGSFAIKKIILK